MASTTANIGEGSSSLRTRQSQYQSGAASFWKVRFSTLTAVSLTLCLSLMSFGVGDSAKLSLPLLLAGLFTAISLPCVGRLRIDGVTVAAVFYLLVLTVMTGLALNAGPQLASYLRFGFWFFAFFLLYPSFCICNYSTVAKAALWFSLILAFFHIIQSIQAQLGMTPFRLVPDSWHMSGAVRWNEEWKTARPAVIFTEVSWYAFYQAVLLSLVLLWSSYKPTSGDWAKIAIVAISLLISGSLVGIVLLLAVFGIWLVTKQSLKIGQLALMVAAASIVTFAFLLTPLGQTTAARLLLEQGEGSFSLRIILPWLRVFSVMQTHPLIGVGIGNEAKAGPELILDGLTGFNNLYAYFLATTGLIGLTGLISFLLSVSRRFKLELMLFLLFGFAHGYGLTEHFWIPTLLWAGSITQRLNKRMNPQ